MKDLIALIACLMIAFGASSQIGLPATPKDTMTCYTPTQVRQIAKGLTELDFCREQLEINRQIVAKHQELHTQTAIELEAAEQEVSDQAKQIERLKKNRKWWFISGTSIILVPLIVLMAL